MDLTTLEAELARLRTECESLQSRGASSSAPALKAFELRGAAGAGAAPLPTQVLSALAAQKDDHAANVRAVEQAYARAIEQAPPAPRAAWTGGAPAAPVVTSSAAPGRPDFSRPLGAAAAASGASATAAAAAARDVASATAQATRASGLSARDLLDDNTFNPNVPTAQWAASAVARANNSGPGAAAARRARPRSAPPQRPRITVPKPFHLSGGGKKGVHESTSFRKMKAELAEQSAKLEEEKASVKARPLPEGILEPKLVKMKEEAEARRAQFAAQFLGAQFLGAQFLGAQLGAQFSLTARPSLSSPLRRARRSAKRSSRSCRRSARRRTR